DDAGGMQPPASLSLLLRLTLLDAFAADLEFDATVALATRRGVVAVHRIGLAETLDRSDAAGRDAMRSQVCIHDVGTTLRQRLVVLRAALRVGVAVDLDLHLRITVEGVHRLAQDRQRLRC